MKYEEMSSTVGEGVEGGDCNGDGLVQLRVVSFMA